MLLAGGIFGFMRRWWYAAALCAGALGCLAAALNGKGGKDE